MRADRRETCDHLLGIEPDVRIAFAQVMDVVAVIDHLVDLDQFHVISEPQPGHPSIAYRSAPTTAFHERLEVGPDRNERIRLGRPHYILGRCFPGMGVGIFRHDRKDIGLLAGHIAHDVGKQGRTDGNLQPVVLCQRERCGRQGRHQQVRYD